MDNNKKIKEEKLLENNRSFWEGILNKTKRVSCANAILGLKEVKTLTGKVKDFKLTSTGCENQRRNGSKFCQECSDKFNNK